MHRDNDRNGWVLAFDTAKKTIRGVAEFGCERPFGLGLVYIASTPSVPVLRAQFANHAIPKYLHLLGILAFKVFN
jgi:hypothetical protein